MRSICYDCFRPTAQCLCAHLPRIANRTGVTVLQHHMERSHPFGSARMLVGALQNAEMVIVSELNERGLLHPLDLPAGAGVLYPHRDAVDLTAVTPEDRPPHLVLLDGTWNKARVMYNQNPWLKALPHYSLTPVRESRYAVRRQPEAHCLSTLEATVEALQLLEPELEGLDDLVALFVRMNDEQVALRERATDGKRERKPRVRRPRAIPRSLADAPERVVVVAVESDEPAQRAPETGETLFQCVAARLTSPETLCAFAVDPAVPPSEVYLTLLGLGADDIEPVVSPDDLPEALAAFLRPDDVLVAWNQRSLDLLPAETLSGRELIRLKSCYANVRRQAGSLDDIVARENLTPQPLTLPGRAAEHLSAVRALTRFLTERTAP